MKFYVKAKNEKRARKILKRAEELGYRWEDEDNRPDVKKIAGYVVFLRVIVEKRLAYGEECDAVEAGYEKIRYKDFVASGFKEGDSVWIIDTGKIYPGNDEVVKRVAEGNADMLMHFQYGVVPVSRYIYTKMRVVKTYAEDGTEYAMVVEESDSSPFEKKVYLVNQVGLARWR